MTDVPLQVVPSPRTPVATLGLLAVTGDHMQRSRVQLQVRSKATAIATNVLGLPGG